MRVVPALIKNAIEIIANLTFIEIHVIILMEIGLFADDNLCH